MQEYSIEFISKIPLSAQLNMIKYYINLIDKSSDDYITSNTKHTVENGLSRFDIPSKDKGNCIAMLSDYHVFMMFNGIFDEKDLTIINLAHTVKMSESFGDEYMSKLLKHAQKAETENLFTNPNTNISINSEFNPNI